MSKNMNQIQALKDAARDKHAATMERVQHALNSMLELELPINFESVALYAKVSKTSLYAYPDLKTQILNIKSEAKNNSYMKDQVLKLKSRDKEIEILARQNRLLRQQIDELKQQLEVAYAHLYKQGD